MVFQVVIYGCESWTFKEAEHRKIGVLNCVLDWLNGHDSEWTPGVGGGQGGPACSGSWGHKESDMTEQLNWSE